MTDETVLELARLYRAVEQRIKRDQQGELFADLQTANERNSNVEALNRRRDDRRGNHAGRGR
jgi:hypothetical protein